MEVLLVPTDLAQAIFNYLNQQPRAEVDAMCVALQRCRTQKLEEPKEEEPKKK